MTTRWPSRLLDLAFMAQSWSKSPDGVGAALSSPDFRQTSFGYSGPVAGYDDGAWMDLPKDEKRALTVHAELNAILNARRDLTGWSIATTKPPCLECVKAILQAGITEVVTVPPQEDSSWLGSQIKGYNLLVKMGASVLCLEQMRHGWKCVPFQVGGSIL